MDDTDDWMSDAGSSYGRKLEDYKFSYITGTFTCVVCDADFQYNFVVDDEVPRGEIIHTVTPKELSYCGACYVVEEFGHDGSHVEKTGLPE